MDWEKAKEIAFDSVKSASAGHFVRNLSDPELCEIIAIAVNRTSELFFAEQREHDRTRHG